MLAQDKDWTFETKPISPEPEKKTIRTMVCGECGSHLVFFNTDPENGLKGYWKCLKGCEVKPK